MGTVLLEVHLIPVRGVVAEVRPSLVARGSWNFVSIAPDVNRLDNDSNVYPLVSLTRKQCMSCDVGISNNKERKQQEN